jgi:hypothetical protein
VSDLWAWYPINKVDGRIRLLVRACISHEGEDVDAGFVLSFDQQEGQEDEADHGSEVIDYDIDIQESIHEELLIVGTNAAHENWFGFEALRELAFPRRDDARCLQ